MKNKQKKGFTIIELVIVMAIIAILAAVLIPTFSNIIKKAQQSSDIQAVRNMNTALAVEQIDNKPENIDNVAVILSEAGFNLPRKPLVSGYEFYWISTENIVVLYNTESEEVEFPEEYKDATYDEETWFSLDWEPVSITEIHNANELYGYLVDSTKTDKAKLVANVSSEDITVEDARHFVVEGIKDLDLNGFTISGKGEKDATEGLDKNAIIYVATSGNLTIHDDSSTHTGKVEGDSVEVFYPDYLTDSTKSAYAIYNYGILTIESGTYSGGKDWEDYDYEPYLLCLDAVCGNDSTKTIINGGIFINQYPTESGSNHAVVNCTINGGLFSHKPLGCTYKDGYKISDNKIGEYYEVVPIVD